MTDSTVYLYLGASASGKTTYVRNLSLVKGNIVVACRDDIRRSLGYPPLGNREQENMVTKIHRGIIEAGINEGLDIHVPDTNLNKQFRKKMIKFCHEHGANVQLVIFDVPLDELRERTKGRPESEQVPEAAMRKQHDSLQTQIKDGTLDTLDFPVQSYEPYRRRDGLGDTVIVDLDGTVANHEGVRSPYDYTKVGLDNPHDDVISVVQSLANDYEVVFVSGRKDSCRADTEQWIREHIGMEPVLYMRRADDDRADFVVKNEIYDSEILPKYNILCAIDDRNQVVRHLRRRGIRVFQVADGRF